MLFRSSVRDKSTRTNNAVESFHAALRRRVMVAHPKLYTFLGHLQRDTADGEIDIARLNRGMSIRRSKKRTYLINEARIKVCISRFDTHACSSARSKSQCGRTRCLVPEDGTADSDTEDDDDVRKHPNSGRFQSFRPPGMKL